MTDAKRAVCSLMAALGLLVPSAVSAQRTVEIARQAGPAVVTLRAYDAAGRELRHGSGFFISDGRIVTNTHVVEGAARVEVFGSDEVLLGSAPHAEAVSSGADIAILPRLGLLPGALSLAPELPATGEEVVVIGAPLGLSNTVSTGIVSAVRRGAGATLIQITAPISPGSSGGPVLNNDGLVVGVAVATLDAGQALNFAVPARDVHALALSPSGRLAFPAERDNPGPNRVSSTRREIRLGQDIPGTLRPGDPQLENGEHYDLYDFFGAAGDHVEISLRSEVFDTYLLLFAEDDPDWHDEDDDGGGGVDAQLRTTLPRTGRYVVVVTSYDASETGRYVLSLRRADAGSTATPTVPSNRRGWITFAETGQGTQSYMPGSIRAVEAGVYEVWGRMTYSAMQVDSGTGGYYDTTEVLWRLDCTGRRVGILALTTYMGERLVNSHTIPSVRMEPVTSESIAAELLNLVCRG